ncbi:MAG: hypothetical protein M1161_05305 [Candidatus Thermoplasmatota archaeon]|nr:hypothetical protein [Candidatus Thermoplasmatota archaeon]
MFNGRVPEGLALEEDSGPQYIAQQFGNSMSLLRIPLNTSRNTLLRTTVTLSRSTVPSKRTASGPTNSKISERHQSP